MDIGNCFRSGLHGIHHACFWLVSGPVPNPPPLYTNTGSPLPGPPPLGLWGRPCPAAVQCRVQREGLTASLHSIGPLPSPRGSGSGVAPARPLSSAEGGCSLTLSSPEGMDGSKRTAVGLTGGDSGDRQWTRRGVNICGLIIYRQNLSKKNDGLQMQWQH